MDSFMYVAGYVAIGVIYTKLVFMRHKDDLRNAENPLKGAMFMIALWPLVMASFAVSKMLRLDEFEDGES
jgi:hypothetical protein